MKMKIVVETLRNSKETLSTQNLIILRNFQYWPKFLVYFKTRCTVVLLSKGCAVLCLLNVSLHQGPARILLFLIYLVWDTNSVTLLGFLHRIPNLRSVELPQ